MNRLIELDFIKVGEWLYEDKKLKHNIKEFLNDSKLLYAFTSETKILYLGKTTSTLKSRMNGYKNANSDQKTNIRVKSRIIESVISRQTISIYIMMDKAELKFKNYNLCLASALEDTLIANIKPIWNDRGVR